MQRLLLIRPAFISQTIRFCLTTGAAASLLLCALPTHAVQVGVSVTGEVAPGVYGRVDVGNMAPPVYYPQPMIISRPVHYVPVAPIYMNVPPGHARHWAKHCGRYHACNRPVYFVRTREYDAYQAHGYREVAPHEYHAHEGYPKHRGGGHGRGHGHGHH